MTTRISRAGFFNILHIQSRFNLTVSSFQTLEGGPATIESSLTVKLSNKGEYCQISEDSHYFEDVGTLEIVG